MAPCLSNPSDRQVLCIAQVQHNDSVLILDEIGQADPHDIGECVYLLSNGIAKSRMTRTGTMRAAARWRLLFFSAGEKKLSDHMGSVGQKVKGGQNVRLLEFDSDGGRGLGVFENLHDSHSGGEFADRLKRNAAEHYGEVGRAYLRYVVNHRSEVKDEINSHISAFVREHSIDGAANEVHRALQRFALTGAAGELATRIGLTGWDQGESLDAAARCFRSWVALRGTAGGSDVDAGLRQLRQFLQRHGGTRFVDLADPGRASIINCAGCKESRRPTRETAYDFYIFAEAFKEEVCSGYDHAAIIKAVAHRGHLGSRENRRYSIKKQVPGLGRTRVYHILSTILDDTEDES